jgi:RNA-directed DNA polymerase
MEAVVERENMTAALKQVRANKGAPGVAGMTIHMLLPFVRQQWPRIKKNC